MKKFNLVIAVLLLLSASVFAVDVALSAEVSGEASVTFGYDLDLEAGGFQNANSADLVITVVEEASVEKGEGDVVGYIMIEDFSAELNDDDGASISAGSVTAKLMLGPVYIDIIGLGNAVDSASLGQGMTPDANDLWAFYGDTVKADPAEEFAGIGIGMDLGVATVEVGVSSQWDWVPDNGTVGTVKLVDAGYTLGTGEAFLTGDATTGGVVSVPATAAPANVDGNYNFYVALGVTAVESLDLDVEFNYEMATEIFQVGVATGYTLPMDDNSVVVKAGLDYHVNDAFTAIEVGVGAGFQFSGDSLSDVEYFGWSEDDELEINPGINLGFGMTIVDGDFDAFGAGVIPELKSTAGSLVLTAYDADLVEGIDIVAYVGLYELLFAAESGGTDIVGDTTYNRLNYGLRASADLDVVSPYAEIWGSPEPGEDSVFFGDDATMFLKLGADFSVIENTTFTLAYESRDLVAENKGKVSFTTKIAY
jgi:hypothetical protein